MANGLTGLHGENVLQRVVVGANHERERVPTQHQLTEEKTATD